MDFQTMTQRRLKTGFERRLRIVDDDYDYDRPAPVVDQPPPAPREDTPRGVWKVPKVKKEISDADRKRVIGIKRAMEFGIGLFRVHSKM